MDKQTFLQQIKGLAEKQRIGFKLDDLLGSDISCEGFLGELINDYGELLLTVVTKGKEPSDRDYEEYWNCIVNPDDWTDEDIEELYEVLSNL